MLIIDRDAQFGIFDAHTLHNPSLSVNNLLMPFNYANAPKMFFAYTFRPSLSELVTSELLNKFNFKLGYLNDLESLRDPEFWIQKLKFQI